MKFDLFLLSPQRRLDKSPTEVLTDTIELVLAAESLGFETAWVAEHHFANLSLSPSPLLTLAHCAARTSRIRLGTGVLVLPLYQPMRLAEEICYVDIVSDGRLNVGVGAGSQAHESRGFGANLNDASARFSESLDILEMAFDTGYVEYQGAHFQVERTPLSLRPLQKPHPPIYVAGMTGHADTTRRIARRGYAAFATLAGPPEGDPMSKRRKYEQGFIDEGRDPAALKLAGQRLIYVTDDPADARDAAEHALYTLRAVRTAKGPAAQFDGHEILPEVAPDEPDVETFLSGAMIGSAEKVATMLSADLATLGLTQLSCFMHFGAMTRARVIGSMERFMRDVVPQLT